VQADNGWMYNTPATYSVYIAGLVFQWLKKAGGLKAMEATNRAKAALLYDFLDQTEFYYSPVDKTDRSLMNVPFRLRNEALNDEFLKQAKQNKLLELKGHRSVGGMRASIYNAMPVEGVKALIAFMREFQTKNG
jgi:phosphoserine aminotransferase